MIIYCTQRGEKSGSSVVYALLEYAYRLKYGTDLPEIKKAIHGKPYFPDFPDVHFSLSHAATHVLCALSDNPVGCDIESPREISTRALGYFSTPEELALFEPLELWVLKESYVKLFGQTIASTRDLRCIRHGDGSCVIRQGDGSCVISQSDGSCDLSGQSGQHDVLLDSSPILLEGQEDRPRVWSKLYHIGECRAAVCSAAEDPPDSLEHV